ncbi:metallophosphoesterase family protein [Piscinibacter sakaiensis]|uniref:metallophosphoesterase family protein n=1 Tax=Piscinibacter sakaiensis TaxID=1547922 RepID=UPI003AB095F6
MSLLLQVSDTHFGTERPEVVSALQRLAGRLQPDVLVVSGDITQRARPAQFEAARRFFDSLRIPKLLAIPGNHDISLFNPFSRLFMPYRRYSRCFGNNLEPELELPDLLLMMLNTTRRWRHVDGQLSPRQIDRVARRLRAAKPSQLRVVVTHQPIAVCTTIDRHNLLHGHRRAIEVWSAAGADLLLGGHIHLPYIRPLHENHPSWVVQAGTAVSSRIRHEAGNSINLIRTGDSAAGQHVGPATARKAIVERWDFNDAVGEFVVHEQQSLACGPVRPPKPDR